MGLKPHLSHLRYVAARLKSCPVTVRTQSEVCQQARVFAASKLHFCGFFCRKDGNHQASASLPRASAAPRVPQSRHDFPKKVPSFCR